MKKIYSFVLMAMMLFIGTNVWAASESDYDIKVVNHTTNKTYYFLAQENQGSNILQMAVDSIGQNQQGTITLNADLELPTTVVIPSKFVVGTGQVRTMQPQDITLDLGNGNVITGGTYDSGKKGLGCIHMLRGKLNITGNGTIQRAAKVGADNTNRSAITLWGASWDQKNAGVWTELIIDKGVTVSSNTVLSGAEKQGNDSNKIYGICLQNDDKFPQGGYGTSDRNASTGKIGYQTDIANATTQEQPCAIKDKDGKWDAGCAFGVKVTIKGKVFGHFRGINILGNINAKPETDIAVAANADPVKKRNLSEYPYYEDYTHAKYYFPYFKIEPSAEVWCISDSVHDDNNGAIYGGGWAMFDINGYVHGQTGILARAGDYTIVDATIESTSENGMKDANYHEGTVSGTAIFVASNATHAGGTNILIGGDSQVSGNGGSAITEVLGSNVSNTKASAITIEGGTFTSENNTNVIDLSVGGSTVTKVEGGNITGEVKVGEETTTVATLVPTTSHTTVVDGTVVVSKGAGPNTETEVKNSWSDVAALTYPTHKVAVWNAAGVGVIGNGTAKDTVKLGELQMNVDDANGQVLTIMNNAVLDVQNLIMNSYAQIIVNPGGKLIIEGEQGITTSADDNIILQANANAQATFVFNPNVKSNREPNAKVELITESRMLTGAPLYTYVFQRFALPIKESVAPTNNYTDQDLFPGQSVFSTSVLAFDYEQNKWNPLTNWNQMKQFTSYQLTNNTKDGGITYTFAGKLHGNLDQVCHFNHEGFGYFGNSHVAPMHIAKFINDFTDDLEKSVWIYNYSIHQYDVINADAASFFPAKSEIKSMQAFVLYLRNGSEGDAKINYANTVWGNPNLGLASAPARHQANTLSNGALIKVVAANGMEDQVIIMEKESYTDNFDNGADATKLMSEEGINLYAITNYGNQSILAVDNLEKTMLTFKSGEATDYTLQIGTVFGEDYAIRDNVTGAVVKCAANVEYAFNQAANTTITGRFEIVSVAEVATAIENTEVKANVKGIYTITGQYVGENFEVLPAGVYVINGVKVVK